MSILSFPFARIGLEEEAPTCGFYWIRRAFGQSGKKAPSDSRFARFLAGLIDRHGFPRPLPHPRHGGGIETGVAPKSEWLRAGVVEWFGDYLPPDTHAALDAAAEALAAADMDQAAGGLRLVGGLEA